MLPTMTASGQEKSVRKTNPLQSPINREALVSSEANGILAAQPMSDRRLSSASPTRSAGLVGLFSGSGALLALLVFLRIPDFIEGSGIG